MRTQEEYDSYHMDAESRIQFGKYKGQPARILLKDEHKNYRKWVMTLGTFGIPLQRYLAEQTDDRKHNNQLRRLK